MEIKTVKDAGIRIAGTAVKSGGQMVQAAKQTFRKGMTASVDGAEEEQTDRQGEWIKGNLTSVEWKQYRKLPLRQRRRYQRFFNSRISEMESGFSLQKGETVQKQFTGNNNFGSEVDVRTANQERGHMSYSQVQPAVSSRTPASYGTASGQKTAGMGNESAASGVSRSMAAAKSGGSMAAKSGGSMAAKGGAVAAKTGIAASGAATAGVTTAAVVLAETAKLAKKAAGKIRNDLTAGTEQDRQQTKEQIRIFQKTREEPAAEKSQKDEVSGSFLIILAVIVVLTFFLSVAVVVSAYIYYTQTPETGTSGNRIVEVARAELADSDSNIGGYKYKDWYGMDADWCAMFVSWCADQCGYIDAGVMPKTASVSTMKEWYDEYGLFHEEAGFIPQPGDIIIFGNGMSHAGIVVDYDPDTKTVTTIEGNTGSSAAVPYHRGSQVKERTYALTYSHIAGFARPEYPEEEAEAGTESFPEELE